MKSSKNTVYRFHKNLGGYATTAAGSVSLVLNHKVVSMWLSPLETAKLHLPLKVVGKVEKLLSAAEVADPLFNALFEQVIITACNDGYSFADLRMAFRKLQGKFMLMAKGEEPCAISNSVAWELSEGFRNIAVKDGYMRKAYAILKAYQRTQIEL